MQGQLPGVTDAVSAIGARLGIPVCYHPEIAPHLEDIAQACGLTIDPPRRPEGKKKPLY
ncbi:carboxyltransferase domain-containing protein [Pseudomonas kitaguniensis]|uniref:carboxyltransferase domain-containing protein n=1 Tax=Pseudomonas kitaguniensis TaxID=2607908 RepID=UPI0031344869